MFIIWSSVIDHGLVWQAPPIYTPDPPPRGGCTHACPKCKISLHNNSNELPSPSLINGKSRALLFHLATPALWIDGVCKDMQISVVLLSSMEEVRRDTQLGLQRALIATIHNISELLSRCCWTTRSLSSPLCFYTEQASAPNSSNADTIKWGPAEVRFCRN